MVFFKRVGYFISTSLLIVTLGCNAGEYSENVKKAMELEDQCVTLSLYDRILLMTRDGLNDAEIAPLVDLLFKNGCDPYVKDPHSGKSILLYWMSVAYEETALVFLMNGNNLSRYTYMDSNVLSWALTRKTYKIADYLMHQGMKLETIYRKYFDNFTDFAVVREDARLMEFGYKWGEKIIEIPNVISGLYPLERVIVRNKVELVKLMLTHGASMELGFPLSQAINPKIDMEILSLLMKNGANPYLVDRSGLNAFEKAEKIGHEKILHFLNQYR